MDPSSPSRAAIVVPVRDGGSLLDAALPALHREAVSSGAILVLVDDASTEPLQAPDDVVVLRNEQPCGPYAARNQAWRATTAPVLLFTDMRCVPAGGWASALIAAVEAGAPFAGGSVQVSPGAGTAAARWSRATNSMDVSGPMLHPYRPYVAACNLAVSRAVLEELDGFDTTRSGGDADLCWRGQLRGLPAPVVLEDAVVEWTPRSTVREVWEQYTRYGRSSVDLARRFAADGAPPPVVPRPRFLGRLAGRYLRAAVRGPDRSAALVGIVADTARGWGQWQQAHGRGQP